MDPRLKVPTRYQPNRRNRRLFGSWRWLRNLILLALLSVTAYQLYYHQEEFRASVREFREEVAERAEEMIPPTATPFIDVSQESLDGDNAFRAGDFPAAVEKYRRVIRGAPNDLEAHYRLAYLLIITSNLGDDLAKLDEALEVSEKAINADPESPKGWAVHAMALVWADRNAESIAYASRALELAPTFVMPKAFIAQAYWRLNRPDLAQAEIDEAIAYLREVGSAEPETVAQVFRTQGYILERQLDREGAITAYERARAAAPYDTYITVELSDSYFGDGHIDDAIELLLSGLDFRPRDTLLLYKLGLIYTNQGDGENAALMFQRCVEVDAKHAGCNSLLGGLKYYADLFIEAIPLLERAIENGSTDILDWWQLGRSHYWLGRCDLAVPVLRDGYALATQDPDSPYIDRFLDGLDECNAGIRPSGDSDE